jgi:iron complex transport system substrate-binding protein
MSRLIFWLGYILSAASLETKERESAPKPEPTAIQFATGFEVEYYEGFKVVTIRKPWKTSRHKKTLLLVSKGAAIPEGYPKATVVKVPVQRFVSLSTTHLHHIEVLGLQDRLVGFSNLGDISSPLLLARVKKGQLKGVGQGGAATRERLLELNPELIMTYGTGAPNEDLGGLMALGIPVVLNAEYLESSPLGYAEWIKFTALFFDLEAEAETFFSQIEKEYIELSDLARNQKLKPTVFMNLPYGGTWYMPGGESFASKLIRDAGGDYLFKQNQESGSLKLSFEVVLDKASKADIWLNPGGTIRLSEILAADKRFRYFSAHGEGRVYNKNLKVLAGLRNDYFEVGLANPHQVLKDLIYILHPQLLPHHKPRWYHRLQ